MKRLRLIRSRAAGRIAAILLVLAMLLPMLSAVTAQAANARIYGYSQGSLEEMFHYGQPGQYDQLEVRPGDEIRIPLTAGMFTWSDGSEPVFREAVTTHQLRSARVQVKTLVQRGNEVLEYVQIETGTFAGQPFLKPGTLIKSGRTAYISIKLAKDLRAVEDVDFRFDICLTIDGERNSELELSVGGTMVVDITEVSEGEEYVDLSEGGVAHATEFVRGIKANLGNGVHVITNMQEDEKYFGRAVVMDTRERMEDAVGETLREIEVIYILDTVNFSPSSKVEFTIGDGDRNYHVYSESFEYLGTMEGQVPLSRRYYMSAERLTDLESQREKGFDGAAGAESKAAEDA